ncbi:TMEM165/GDT1 family protein [Pontixanthobacter aestiaquae]|uniref:GDT1 family protein n=1 Tax=Pontixanthobacter aestiaquae TaxID=1509367 RepID=A0A844Z6B6_9SPHN|nr:TMEM165/GDT1 family protein [Pontixanthobacter aestiaquae]MDN3646393.1 TMEM165/GDT1 family protein [Pontixanthobacter aestiaquae]MXO82617.1 hypothetical protein [Pontixanthobacter aestiaquae]
MSAFLFALVAVMVTSLGSRDQLLIANISGRLGRSIPLLVISCCVAVITALLMTLSGQYIAALLPSAAKTMLVAFALMIAAVELAWPNKRSFIKEPTRSLTAIGVVLFVRQVGDGSRFLIFAFAAGSGTPWFAAVGGALGGIGAVLIGWMMADELAQTLPLRSIRLVLSVVLAIGAIVTGLSARGLIG